MRVTMASQATVENFSQGTDQDGRIEHRRCVACGGSTCRPRLTFKTRSVTECSGCGLQWQVPQPSNDELAEIYGTYYFLGSEDTESKTRKLQIKEATSQLYLDMIKAYRGNLGGSLLEVGSGQGEFLLEALRRGYEVTGVEYSATACSMARNSLRTLDPSAESSLVVQGEVETADLKPSSFDLCVMNDVIEHVRDPQKTIARIRSLLKPGGTIFIATPSLDSWSARLMGKLWMEYKDEHLFFFGNSSLSKLLEGNGFGKVTLRPGYKILTLEYVAQHFEKFPVPGFSKLVCGAVGMLPTSVSRRPVKIVASGVIGMATAI